MVRRQVSLELNLVPLELAQVGGYSTSTLGLSLSFFLLLSLLAGCCCCDSAAAAQPRLIRASSLYSVSPTSQGSLFNCAQVYDLTRPYQTNTKEHLGKGLPSTRIIVPSKPKTPSSPNGDFSAAVRTGQVPRYSHRLCTSLPLGSDP